jgi:IS30 family transposase
METTKINLELPPTLPHGWKTAIAKILTIHPNTVKEALKRGGDDPTYLRIMKAAKEKYGKPIKPKVNEETTNHPV